MKISRSVACGTAVAPLSRAVAFLQDSSPSPALTMHVLVLPVTTERKMHVG